MNSSHKFNIVSAVLALSLDWGHAAGARANSTEPLLGNWDCTLNDSEAVIPFVTSVQGMLSFRFDGSFTEDLQMEMRVDEDDISIEILMTGNWRREDKALFRTSASVSILEFLSNDIDLTQSYQAEMLYETFRLSSESNEVLSFISGNKFILESANTDPVLCVREDNVLGP